MVKFYLILCFTIGTATSCFAKWQISGTTVYKMGNVGINTGNPVAPMHDLKINIFGYATSTNTTVNNLLVILTPYASNNPSSYNGDGYDWRIQFWGNNDQGYNRGKTSAIYAVREDPGSAYNKAVVLTFQTTATDQAATERLRFAAYENIGVGTSNFDANFAVKGLIRAQELKVDMKNWRDYVIKQIYGLWSLTEVKAYSDQNKYLPDVPSKKGIVQNGQNLGEMNKILL